MRYIKCYFMFVPPVHRVIMYVIVPLFALLVNASLALAMRTYGAPADMPRAVTGSLYVIILTVYEIMMDARIFEGSLRRGNPTMEYLKSSAKGLTFYKDVLYGDQLMRILLHFYGIGTSVVAGGSIQGKPLHSILEEWILYFALSFGLAQLGVVMVRLIKSEQAGVYAGMLIAFIAGTIFTGALLALPWKINNAFYYIAFAALFAGSVLIRFMTVRSLKMKEEEYYDR